MDDAVSSEAEQTVVSLSVAKMDEVREKQSLLATDERVTCFVSFKGCGIIIPCRIEAG